MTVSFWVKVVIFKYMAGDGVNTEGQNIGPTASMAGRRIDFGKVGEGEGLAWGIEVDIDISDNLVRSRFQETSFKIPDHIKKIKYLELAPQEALPPDQRTIRSHMKPRSILGSSSLIPVATPAKQGNPTFEKIRHGFNILRPEDEARFKSLRAMVNWSLVTQTGKKRFNEVLKETKGDTLVIVHGHSADLSGMGEQYLDETHNKSGGIVQRMYNFVPMDEILERYNDSDKFAAIVLHGCNTEKGVVEAKKIPVFYPTSGVKQSPDPGFIWSKPGGVAIPEN